jgi:hypothetical protein
MTERTQLITSLIILCIVLGGMAGCAPRSTQPTVPPSTQPAAPASTETSVLPTVLPAPTLRPGWETHSASADQRQCGYSIDHPSEMDGASQAMYSWTLNYTSTEPSGPTPNFIYVSVIPADFQGGSGEIYNYDPAETQTLLNMQVGESRSLRENLNIDSGFTFTRLPDTTLGNQTAQTYENTQPWEFPSGTKEIRYYLQGNGCTYLIGGYMATVDSSQPGAINEELFDQIIATFRLAP